MSVLECNDTYDQCYTHTHMYIYIYICTAHSPAMNVVTEEDVRTKLKRFGKFILDVVPVSCESGLNLPTAKEVRV
jgi:hypothetical protein